MILDVVFEEECAVFDEGFDEAVVITKEEPGVSENLDAELQAQDEIIEKIAAALQGKAAGGTMQKATVELVTHFAFGHDTDTMIGCVYFDGESYKKINIALNESETINPVVNSIIVVGMDGSESGVSFFTWSENGVIDVSEEYQLFNGNELNPQGVFIVYSDGLVHIGEDEGGLEGV